MKTDFATFGNFCHATSQASVLAYTALAVLFASPGNQFFDADWVEHGFCVTNKAVPYWNSHDLCLYFDTFLVLLGFAVYLALRGAPGMKAADELLFFGLLGHLGHGAAHGFLLAPRYRNSIAETDDLQLSTWDKFAEMEGLAIAVQMAVFVLFWCGLLKGVAPKLSNAAAFFASIWISIGGIFVRDVLGFAYVQAVLTAAISYSQVTIPRDEKGFVFAANAAVAIPLSLIPWAESMACQSIVSKFGGHLMYDVSIPILTVLSYLASYHHYSKTGGEKGKLE